MLRIAAERDASTIMVIIRLVNWQGVWGKRRFVLSGAKQEEVLANFPKDDSELERAIRLRAKAFETTSA